MGTVTVTRRNGLAMGILAMLAVLLMTSASATSSKGSAVFEEDTREAAEEAGEESWTSWAKEKISEGLGLKQREEEEEKAAKTATDEVTFGGYAYIYRLLYVQRFI